VHRVLAMSAKLNWHTWVEVDDLQELEIDFE
jgi:hypothetical protein